MNASPSRCHSIEGLVPIVFSLVCAALMILAAFWKRGTPTGTLLRDSLEWTIEFLVSLVMMGICAAGVSSRNLSRSGQRR